MSPILFMLYIAPIFRLGGLKNAFGYADDFAILETSRSLEENALKVRDSINLVLSWGDTEGVTFDPKKSELLHFSRKYRDKTNRPIIQTAKFPISENLQRLHLKWLGIHFDRKLTFKTHVQIQTAKALRVANALRCLGNTSRGTRPYLSRKAINACVMPIAYFGAETWWPGKTRTKGDKIVSNRVGSHINLIDKVHSAAARSMLPVFCTTPAAALLRESGLNTAEITLHNTIQRAAIRTRRLDPYHPLYLKALRSLSGPTNTHFARSIQGIPP